MFSNLNIKNSDLLYISKFYLEDDINRIGEYNQYTLGLSRLNPLSILDIFKLYCRRNKLDFDLFLHTCDFHSLALLIFWRIFRKDRTIIYANHDALPHSGYKLHRKCVIYSITYLLFRYSKECVFFSEYNKKIALEHFSFLKSRDIEVNELPTPAEVYPKSSLDKSNLVLAFGRNERYKFNTTFSDAFVQLLSELDCAVHLAGGMADNSDLLALLNGRNYTTTNGYVEESKLVELCDRAKYVLVNYNSLSQSGIIAFARRRGCSIIVNEEIEQMVHLLRGDVVLRVKGGNKML